MNLANMWVCDFETLTAADDRKSTYIWLFTAVNLGNMNCVYGSTMEEFIDFLQYTKGLKRCFFHNLKFDGEFITHHLLTNNYEYYPHQKDVPEHSFSILRSTQGAFYSMKINFKYKAVEIWDSLKLLPAPVERLAHDYKLDICKLKIDYDTYRPYGYKANDSELQYGLNDVLIVAQVLRQYIMNGNTKMTVGGNAYARFLSTLTKAQKQMISYDLSDGEDEYIRKAYQGGFCWVNPLHQNQDIGCGLVYDNNSMHPSQLRYKPMPYGQPIPFTGEPDNPDYSLYVVRVNLTAKLKANHIPCISARKSFRFADAEYISEVNNLELVLTNLDLDLIYEQYDVSPSTEYLDGYYFTSCTGLFNKFIDSVMEIKMKSTGAQRQFAKLDANNIYGKFGTNPRAESVEPYLVDGVVHYRKSDIESTPQKYYLPIAVFTTAYSRYQIITEAQKNYDRILYCDTDSLHLTGYDLPELDIDDRRLGAWKLENKFTRARFLRPKRYIEVYDTYQTAPEARITVKQPSNRRKRTHLRLRDNKLILSHLEVKAGGMPNNVKQQVTWDNFHTGTIYHGKLLPHHIQGGIVLKPHDFQLN